MKLVYVAGPYRATTVWGVEQNILAAQAVGAQVLAIDGLHPVIPHMNTRQMEGIASDEQVLAGTLEMLRRCAGADEMLIRLGPSTRPRP